MARALSSFLIVEDDANLASLLAEALEERAPDVRCAETVRAAIEALRQQVPDVLFLDVELPDGDAFDILQEMIEIQPMPLVIGMSGCAEPNQSFELAKYGVRAYLQKPLSLEKVDETLQWALENPPEIKAHVKGAVGHVPVRELEQEVRDTMLNEAMARSGGNRNAAARLLKVSRQLLQHWLRKLYH